MAQSSWPFETLDTSETQYSSLFAEFQDSGVAGDDTTVSVKAQTSIGLDISVTAGFAIIRGFAYLNTSTLTVSCAAAGAQPRIDTVILTLDPSANSIVAGIKTGTAAAVPSAPALTQTPGGVWELPLADILVPAGATALDPANLTDRRQFLGTQVGLWYTNSRPTSPDKGRLGFNLTLSELEYFDGTVWASLEFNIPDGSITNAKLAIPPYRYVSTGYYLSTTKSIAPSDAGKLFQFNTGSSNVTVTITANCLAIGDRVDFIQEGSGTVTFTFSSPVVVASVLDKRKLTTRYTACTLICTGTDQFRLVGSLEA